MGLVLSRKRNEVVRIGHDIKVTVIEIRGDKCRLFLEAPADVPIHRQEVYEAIERRGGFDKPDAEEVEA